MGVDTLVKSHHWSQGGSWTTASAPPREGAFGAFASRIILLDTIDIIVFYIFLFLGGQPPRPLALRGTHGVGVLSGVGWWDHGGLGTPYGVPRVPRLRLGTRGSWTAASAPPRLGGFPPRPPVVLLGLSCM